MTSAVIKFVMGVWDCFASLAMTSPVIGIRDVSLSEADKVDGHCEELATKQSHDPKSDFE